MNLPSAFRLSWSPRLLRAGAFIAVGALAAVDLGGCQKKADTSAPTASERATQAGAPARDSPTEPLGKTAGAAAATVAAAHSSPPSPRPLPVAGPAPAATPWPIAAPPAAAAPATSAATSGGSASSTGSSRTTLADLLPAGMTLNDPAQRAKVVAQMRAAEQQQKAEATAKADQLGLPKRVVRPDGSVIELMRFEGGKPIYIQTHNVNASLTTNATPLRAAPYSVTGSGFTVGVWDGGAVRSTHQEFGARVTIKDGAALLDHSTHVGGTIAAAGVDAAAKGMATAVKIDSYEWNSEKSEMTARGASYPGETGTIYLSNHSYGYVGGWTYTGYTTPKWNWYGTGTTSTGVEDDFGKYAPTRATAIRSRRACRITSCFAARETIARTIRRRAIPCRSRRA